MSGLVVFVLAAAYLGAAWYFSDRVPSGTTVAGVDIAGQARTDAITALEDSLAEIVAAPIPVVLGTPEADASSILDAEEERASQIDPDAFTFDAAATVDSLIGFSLEPGRLLDHLFGGGAVDPVTRVDTEAVTAAVEALAPDLQIPPVEGSIELSDGAANVTAPENGVDVDVPASVDLLSDDWLTGRRPFTLPVVSVSPTIDSDEIDRAMAQLVDPILSGPITVHLADEATVELTPADLTAVAHIVADGDRLTLEVMETEASDLVGERASSIGKTAQDARIVIEGGKPTIVPSKTGAGVDPAELAGLISAAATATGDGREATLDLATTEPEFTTEDAEKLKVTERVSYFSTPMPYNPVRTQNLLTGTKKVTNTLVKPGETFSLIDALGPIDAAHGYTSSGVVVSGFATEAMGGGLSQLSTTTFNAAYEAGMEDVSHKPHSRYFSRYPEGREATMFAPSLDMKWRNNTPYGVLVQAWVADSKTQVAFWSTPYWDVSIQTGPRRNITPPTTVYNTASTCAPESGGQSGFTVHIERTVSHDGARNEEYSGGYSHTYQPWNKVVCGPKPDPDDKKSDD
ncbi:vanomycin resistance protein VanB [Pseudactinotalea sp. HY160]|nr:vanomycin resistance protein VanB [Pseudactinotalea sp. HY160]